jgi:general secretion pathway protein J
MAEMRAGTAGRRGLIAAGSARASRTSIGAERGFTLVEILIAMTLLALLIGLAVGALRTAVQATRSGEALIQRTDRLRTAQEFLRRQLSHALPLPFERIEDTGENKVFMAERDSLRFVAPMPGFLARGGPHVQWLTFARSRDGGMHLEFDHAQLNGYDPDNPKGDSERKPVVLLDGIRDGRFEFRALDENGELGDWDSAWDDPQRMPLMVRLRVEFDEDSRQRWPALEIPLRTAGMSAMMPGVPRLTEPRQGGPSIGPLPPEGLRPEQGR